MKDYTKEQTIKLINDFIAKNNLRITIKEIENIIFESNDHHIIFQIWLSECEKAGLDLDQTIIDLITNCWNNFPHKTLGGKSPTEMYKR